MIKAIDGSGRGLVAKRAYRPGDLVLSEEPYAMVMAAPYAGVCCSYCGLQTDQPMLALSPDDCVRYCSEKCITLDYPVHSLETSAIASLMATGVTGSGIDAMRLVIRIGALRKHEAGSKTDCSRPEHVENGRENTYNHALLLEGNTLSCSPTAAREVKQTAQQLSKLSIGLPLTATDTEFFLYAIQCNAHTISDDGRAVGLGLFPMTSMMNHSCSPNCVHQFLIEVGRPPRLIMRAVADITLGEELVYSYVNLYQSTQIRQAQLYSAYSFNCVCTRCTANVDDCLDRSDVDASHDASAVERNIYQMTGALNIGDSGAITSGNSEAWTALTALLCSPEIAPLHPSHRLLVQCYHTIVRYVHAHWTISDSSRWVGVGYGLLAVACMKRHIPQVQPEIGVLEGQLADVIVRLLTTFESHGHHSEGVNGGVNRGEGGGEGEGEDLLLAAIPQDFIFSRDLRVRELLQGLVIKLGGMAGQGTLKERWGTFAKKLKQSSIKTALICRKAVI